MAQEVSRLQSTLEYLLLKGDVDAAQHEIAVLAHNHDVVLAALTNDHNEVIAATHRAWLGKQMTDVLPQFDNEQAAGAIRERRAGMTSNASGDALLGYAGILMGSAGEGLRPSRTGSLFLAYDLKRYKAEARAQVIQQSLYWAGLGDGAGALHVARLPLPADAAHRAAGERGGAACHRESRGAQRPQGAG